MPVNKLFIAIGTFVWSCCVALADENWPSFRGPGASGVSPKAAPTSWDVPSNRNVRWMTPVPGLALSSPVIHGEHLLVTTAVGQNENKELKVGLYGDIQPVNEHAPYTFKLLCLDKNTGQLTWERTAHEGIPRVKRHPKSSHANPTPATDGKHVVAFFGSEGLYCYDVKGDLIWKKDLGVLDSGFFRVPTAQWGFASSPVIHGDRVIVQCDVQKGSFVAAFSLKDGGEIWRTPREEVPTWSTPTVHVSPQRSQVICNGWKEIAGYDLASGKRLWHMRGGGDIPVPTPVVAHDLIFITNAHGSQSPVYAIRATAAGDITLPDGETSGEHVAWSHRRGGNYMQTPIVVGEHLFLCRDNGVVTCFDAKSGKKLGEQKLGDGRTGFTASPVAAADKLYFTSEEGNVYVVSADPKMEVLGTNPLGDLSMATPAVSDGTLFFRTRTHLVAVR
jgi:outer membrane protein assembly factor BamB